MHCGTRFQRQRAAADPDLARASSKLTEVDLVNGETAKVR